MFKKTLLLVILVLVPILSRADVNGDLGDFFSKLGYDGNINSPTAYTSQAAGYYSGGSIFLRNRVKNIQLIHLDMPTFRSGCGGIDLFAGGFSFIKASQLTKFFQDIMISSGGYALNLALETECPEIAHSMQYLQQIAQKINDTNLNSCDMAEDLVGGIFPKTVASQQQVCKDIGNQHNWFADWADARQQCSTQGGFNDTMGKAAKDPEHKASVIVNKNLVWSALKDNGFISTDTELAELFMSLSGTIIYTTDGSGNNKVTVLRPLSGDQNLVKALLYGGAAPAYICHDTNLCLNPTQENGTITIKPDKSLNAQVTKIITDLVETVRNDQPISQLQKGFLQLVSIPVLKFITVSLSLGNGSQALDLTSYSEVISKDLLKQYMLEILQLVDQSITAGSDYTPEVKQQLRDQILKSIANIENIKTSAHNDLQDSMALINSVKGLESEVTSRLSDQLKDSLTLSGGST